MQTVPRNQAKQCISQRAFPSITTPNWSCHQPAETLPCTEALPPGHQSSPMQVVNFSDKFYDLCGMYKNKKITKHRPVHHGHSIAAAS